MDNITAILITVTVLALLCPSAYEIAINKNEHETDKPILYAGIGISGLTLMGALTNTRWVMWIGLISAVLLFLYIILIYKEEAKPSEVC